MNRINIVYKGAIDPEFIKDYIDYGLGKRCKECCGLPEQLDIHFYENLSEYHYNTGTKNVYVNDIDFGYYSNILEIMNKLKTKYPNLIEILSIYMSEEIDKK